MSLPFILLEFVAPLIASGVTLAAKPLADWLSKRFSANLDVLVTLKGGKTEQLTVPDKSTETLSKAFSEYLMYEDTVRDALQQISGSKIYAQNAPNEADFVLDLAGKTYLVEAKTTISSSTGKHLHALLKSGHSKELFLVTPEAVSKEKRQQLESGLSTNIRFLNGTDVDSLRDQFTNYLKTD